MLPQHRNSHIPKYLFRKFPPIELVNDILRLCGLSGELNDRRQFKKECLAKGLITADSWLPILEPYYLPCKSKRFFHDGAVFDTGRIITILRHILGPHNYILDTHERAEHGVKHTFYMIKPILQSYDLSGANMEVTFI